MYLYGVELNVVLRPDQQHAEDSRVLSINCGLY